MIALAVSLTLVLIAAAGLVLAVRRMRRRIKSEPHKRIDLFHRDC